MANITSSRKTAAVIRDQLPEFVKKDSPKFIEFLKAYYTFLETYNIDVSMVRDVDLTSDLLVGFIKSEVANKFPAARINDRELVKIIKEIYKAKGTVKGFELLFNIFFGEAITVYQPNENILRSSDGKWIQHNFATFAIISGTSTNSIYFTVNSRKAQIENIEMNGSTGKVFYSSSIYLEYAVGDIIRFYNQDGVELGVASVSSANTKIRMVRSGLNWIEGQLFTIPGLTRDTVVRVKKVNDLGSIVSFDVVSSGDFHTLHQIVKVSPHTIKPFYSAEVQNTSLVGTDYSNPSKPVFIFEATKTLADTVALEERLAVYKNSAIVYAAHNSPKTNESINPDLTVAEWDASHAIFVVENQTVTTDVGAFYDDSGMLSNPDIRLQDSYFYQLFSYVIESGLSIEEWKETVDLIHPAGLKYFSNFTKNNTVDVNVNLAISRVLSKEIPAIVESISLNEARSLQLTKNLTESININAGEWIASSDPLPYSLTNEYFAEDYNEFGKINIIIG